MYLWLWWKLNQYTSLHQLPSDWNYSIECFNGEACKGVHISLYFDFFNSFLFTAETCKSTMAPVLGIPNLITPHPSFKAFKKYVKLLDLLPVNCYLLLLYNALFRLFWRKIKIYFGFWKGIWKTCLMCNIILSGKTINRF